MRFMHSHLSPLRGRSLIAAAASAVLALGAIGGGVAFATGVIPGPDGVIHGCYQRSSNDDGGNKGSLRVIDPATQHCSKGETAISWNQTGPQGPAGPQGLQGVQGTPGVQGNPGTNGTNGSPGAPGADGAAGTTGPAGPSDLYSQNSDTGPDLASFNLTDLLSLDVPAGSYLVSARVNITNHAGGIAGANCKLSTDGGISQESQDLSGGSGFHYGDIGSFKLQDAERFNSATTIKLQCQAGQASTSYVRLSAIKLGTLH